MAEKKEEKEEPKYSVAEVATETGQGIVVDGKIITQMELLVEIANKLDKIEKNVV